MIYFYSEDIRYPTRNKTKIKTWLQQVAKAEKKKIRHLNIIYCSDLYLLQLNKTYLNHHTLTDVITFEYTEEQNNLEGDIFISIERVKYNADELNISTSLELCRVMVHGLLHLMGYEDKTPSQKDKMRKKEDSYLIKLNTLRRGKTKK